MSDQFWTALFAAHSSGIIVISTIIIAWMQHRANKQLRAIHTLVNSATGVQLKLNAELSRWKAVQTNDPDHSIAADKAERLYLEHEEKQAKVDRTL